MEYSTKRSSRFWERIKNVVKTFLNLGILRARKIVDMDVLVFFLLLSGVVLKRLEFCIARARETNFSITVLKLEIR